MRFLGTLLTLLIAGWVTLATPTAANAFSLPVQAMWPDSPSATLEQEDLTPGSDVTATVRVRGLNARTGPGMTYRILTVLREGDMVNVLGQFGNCSWLHIKKAGNPELDAWIAGGSAYVTISVPCSEIPVAEYAPTAGAADESPAPAGQDGSTAAERERPDTGAILFDGRLVTGSGELIVDNRTDGDGVATLVYPGTTNAIIAFYVRQNERWTLKGVPDGVFEFKFTTGKQWDSKEGQFDKAGMYWKLDSHLAYVSSLYTYTWYSVTLHEVEDGNTAKVPLSKQQFPDLSQP